jgi:hypothetical protein
MGRLALALGGMIIGGVIGGPFGARIGFALGSFLGGRLFGDEQVTEGPRIEDRAVSTATYGAPIPIVYGTVRCTGSYIWVQGNELIEVRKEEEVGKGGGGSYVYYEYYITCAVAICEGPVQQLLRIWGDTKLIYELNPGEISLQEALELLFASNIPTYGQDTSKGNLADLVDLWASEAGNPSFRKAYDLDFTFYKGDEEQLQDPLIVAEHGATQVPAFRGMSYVVFERLPLKDLGNRPPNFSFEISKTPSPYTIDRFELPNGTRSAGWQGWDLDPEQNYLYAVTGTYEITKWDIKTGTIVGSSAYEEGQEVQTTTLNAIYSSIDTPTYGTGQISGLGGLTYTEAGLVVGTGFAFFNVIVDLTSLLPVGGYSLGVTYASQQSPPSGLPYVFTQAPGNQGTDICFASIGNGGAYTEGINFEALSGGSGTYAVAFPESINKSLESFRGQDFVFLWDGIGGKAFRFGTLTYPADNMVDWIRNAGNFNKEWYSGMTNPPQNSSFPFWLNGRLYVPGLQGVDEVEYGTGESIANVPLFPNIGGVDRHYNRQAWDRSILQDRYIWLAQRGNASTGYFAKVDLACMEVVDTESFSLWDGERYPGEMPTNGQVYIKDLDAWLTWSDADGRWRPVLWRKSGRALVTTLREIVEDLSSRTILEGAQYDATDLDKIVPGFQITRPTQTRRPIEELMTVYGFDAYEADGKVVFFEKEKEAGIVIDANDFGAGDLGEIKPRIEENRLQDLELPYRLEYTYMNITDYHQEDTQDAHRANEATASREHIDLRMPLVHIPDEAKQVAERILYSAWIERRTVSFSLPRKYNYLHPGSCIAFGVDDVTYANVRIVKMTEMIANTTVIEFQGVVMEADAYGLNLAFVEPVYRLAPYKQDILDIGETELFLMDTPLLLDQDEATVGGFYYAAARDSIADGRWRGAQIFKSADNSNYSAWNAVVDEIPWGYITLAPGDSPSECAITDEDSYLEVSMVAGADSLASTTRLGMMNGANPAMIEIANVEGVFTTEYDGEWEILQFETVEQISANIYRLSQLLRGRRGTEHLTGLIRSGARMVFPSVGPVVRTANTADIGLLRYYKGVSIGNSFSPNDPEEFTQAGRGRRPYNPSHVEWTRDGSGNFTISWTRRTRNGGENDWLDGVANVPLAERAETYEVDVLDQSGNVLRTIEVTSETASYTAAQQVADFGALPSRVDINVYQTNESYGRSVPTAAELS